MKALLQQNGNRNENEANSSHRPRRRRLESRTLLAAAAAFAGHPQPRSSENVPSPEGRGFCQRKNGNKLEDCGGEKFASKGI